MVAHITGNLVVLAPNIAEGFKPSDLLKIVVLPVFFCAVMALTAMHDRFCNAPRQVSLLLRLEAVLIADSGVLGVWATLAGWSLDFWVSLLIVTPVVCGMAVQKATHRLICRLDQQRRS